MKFFSMFTGVGGFEIGIQNAFESRREVEKTFNDNESLSDNIVNSAQERRQSATCVGYSEIDKFACKVMREKYPEVHNYGDATKINAEELPDFDLLVGGFPCQAFSIAGARKGFEDARGTLFYDIARIARAKRPEYLLLENVKGLVNHEKGKTLSVILSTFQELGYGLEWGVVNSRYFGVPQNRERVFIIGRLGEGSARKVFPQLGTNRSDSRETGQEVSVCLDANYYKGTDANGLARMKRQHVEVSRCPLRTHKDGNGFREVKSGNSPTIPARAREDGSGQPIIMKAYDGQNGNIRKDNVCDTLQSEAQAKQTYGYGVTDMTSIRRLTPIECERLQGFPDDWTKYGREEDGTKVEISDTQRYKMMGNAVTTNVVQSIITEMFK